VKSGIVASNMSCLILTCSSVTFIFLFHPVLYKLHMCLGLDFWLSWSQQNPGFHRTSLNPKVTWNLSQNIRILQNPSLKCSVVQNCRVPQNSYSMFPQNCSQARVLQNPFPNLGSVEYLTELQFFTEYQGSMEPSVYHNIPQKLLTNPSIHQDNS
jgi:hypothetical protein